MGTLGLISSLPTDLQDLHEEPLQPGLAEGPLHCTVVMDCTCQATKDTDFPRVNAKKTDNREDMASDLMSNTLIQTTDYMTSLPPGSHRHSNTLRSHTRKRY